MELREKCIEVGRLLNGMVTKSELFCGESKPVIKEASAEYYIFREDDLAET